MKLWNRVFHYWRPVTTLNNSTRSGLDGDLYDELYLELLEKDRQAELALGFLQEIDNKLNSEEELNDNEARTIGLIKL